MILTKTLSLANRDPLTDLEALERANEWMEALIETVPLEMLDQCFANARHEHSGPFPINYHELLDAYKRLRKLSGEDPGHSSYKAAVSPSKPMPSASCDRCHGTTHESVYDRLGNSLGVKPYGSCDHRAVEPGEGLAIHLAQKKEKAARGMHALPEAVRGRLFSDTVE